ncbi:MAG: SIMPL domain-containing protein [Candidatus Komeilibacteria bacterium]
MSHWQKALLIITASFFLLMGGIVKLRELNYVGKSPDYQPTISVTGEGKVQAVPDVAKVSFGYTVTKNTVAEAQKDNTDKMNTFIAAVKKEKVDAKDIKTSNFSVNPTYDYVDGRQVPRGFTVSQNIDVTLRDTSKAQAIIQLAGDNGLNQVGNLQFTVDNPQNFLADARKIALKQAKDNAKAIADNAGFKLGRLMSYYENTQPYTNQPMYAMDKATGMGGGVAVPAPTIEPGTNEVYVQVSLNYEIK